MARAARRRTPRTRRGLLSIARPAALPGSLLLALLLALIATGCAGRLRNPATVELGDATAPAPDGGPPRASVPGPDEFRAGKPLPSTDRPGSEVVVPDSAADPTTPSAARPPKVADVPLRVGTSGDYPPFSFLDDDGVLEGFDIDVARAWARDRGRYVEFVTFRWPDLRRALLAGDFDVAMSGVTVRGDRLVAGPMTATIARGAAVLVVRPGGRVPSLAGGGKGLKVAVNRGGHLEQVARDRLPRADLVVVDDNRSLPGLLGRGEVDAVVSDTLEAATFRVPATRDGPADSPVTIAAVLAQGQKAYWVRPGLPALAADLDAWLAEREADHSLSGLRARWEIDEAAESGDMGGSVEEKAGDRPLGYGTEARLLDLLARRLMLMPLVAEAKRAAALPIDAPEREAALEKSAIAAAERAGLDPGSYLELLRAEIGASKDIQRAVLAGPPQPGFRAPDGRAFSLDGDVRPAIDAVDEAIRRELVRAAPVRAPVPRIVSALRADATVPGLDGASLEGIARALVRVPAAVGGGRLE